MYILFFLLFGYISVNQVKEQNNNGIALFEGGRSLGEDYDTIVGSSQDWLGFFEERIELRWED